MHLQQDIIWFIKTMHANSSNIDDIEKTISNDVIGDNLTSDQLMVSDSQVRIYQTNQRWVGYTTPIILTRLNPIVIGLIRVNHCKF